MRNAATAADEIEEQLADARQKLSEDARSGAAEVSSLTEWRDHFHEHPWLFTGAAAALGFVLTPRRRRESSTAVDSRGATESSDSNRPAGLNDAMARSRNDMLRASIASLAVALAEEGLILGVRRGHELLCRAPTKTPVDATTADSEKATFQDDTPEETTPGQSASSRQDINTDELQRAADHLRRYLKSAIADHPQMSLIAATAAGVALGWTVKRK